MKKFYKPRLTIE